MRRRREPFLSGDGIPICDDVNPFSSILFSLLPRVWGPGIFGLLVADYRVSAFGRLYFKRSFPSLEGKS